MTELRNETDAQKGKLDVCVIQCDVIIGEPDRNFERVSALLEDAVKGESKPDVIILPEMWNTGYALDRILELADPEGRLTQEMMSAFAARHGIYLIAGSVAVKNGEGVRNTTYIFDRQGRLTADYSKIHLFRLMDEEKHLTAGERVGSFNLDGTSAASMICYDIRFPELARKLALDGAQILFVPAEWPHPRLHHWRTLLQARAIENQMYVVACNRVGVSGTNHFFGHSMIIDPWGEIVAEGGEEETLLSATLDLDALERVRKTIPIFEDRRPQLY